MLKRIRIALIICVLGFVSCNNDQVEPLPVPEDILRIQIQPVFGSADLSLDQTFTTSEGYKVQFTDIKCYFTSMKNGSNELFDAALYDYRENGTLLIEKAGDPELFGEISGFLGVDSQYNHDDPSAFPNTNPLNISIANDMHWDWNPGYIFVKLEGKVDTIPDAIENFDHFAVFHVGGDNILQTISLSSMNWQAISSGVYQSKWKLDLEKFLQNGSQTIDLKTEFSSHSSAGQEALTLKVIQNFKDAISLY